MPPSSLNRSSSSDMKFCATVLQGFCQNAGKVVRRELAYDCGRLLDFQPWSGSSMAYWD